MAALPWNDPLAVTASARTSYDLCLQVRRLVPADRERVRAFFDGLSDQARYRRFMNGKPHLTARDLDALLDVDHRARAAVVAVDPASGDIVAEARYAQWPSRPDTADVAFVVADLWQRQGIATMLTLDVVRRARANGFTQLTASTFGDNAPARTVLRRAGFETVSIAGGVAELVLDLS